MDRLRVWPLLVITLGLLGGFVFWNQLLQPDIIPTPAARVTTEVTNVLDEQVIAEYFTPLTPFRLGATTLQVSVADTRETRIQGLSNTPWLPPGVGKLFVFESADAWSIWMKDMQYPLDIIWLDAAQMIVHIEENVSPDTYPDTFSSPTPARYVLEVNAGAVAAYGWAVGDQAAW